MDAPLLEDEVGGDEQPSSFGSPGGEGWRRGRCASPWAEEARKIGCLAAPMAAVNLAQFAVQTVSNAMVGHLGVLPLSASAIATSFANVAGFSLLLGMASGLETLCGQAYGAKQYHQLGIDTYRAIFTLILTCLPISVLWMFMGKIFLLVGQDPDISREAGKYIIWLIPSVFAHAVLQPLLKFLQAQSLTLPMLAVSTATLCFHVPFCWVMVFKSGLGFIGAAISVCVSNWLSVLVISLYIRYSDACKATRAPLTVDAFRGIGRFLRVALPSALMICLEWWSYEFLTLMAGLLPNPELETSVLSISLSSVTLLYTIPYGIGAAASTRISNKLGAGDHGGARLVVRVVMAMAATEAVIVSGALLASRWLVARAYSDDKAVISYVVRMIPLVCVTAITDGIQGILSGIARGCGWQHLGAYVNLAAFYLIGNPTGIILGLVLHLGGRGLWTGIICGSITQSTLLCIITSRINWRKMATEARERVFSDDKLLIS